MKGPHACERCGELLKRAPVWLELNNITGEWVRAGSAPWSDGPDSQGGFTFGATCAKRTLKTQNAYDLK